MKLRSASLIVLTFLAAGCASALERPNFNGTWVSPENPSRTMTITQDDSSLTQTDGRNTFTWRLDGSENRAEITTVRGETWMLVSTARWVGYGLVIATTTTRETGQSWESMTIYTLDALPNCTVGAGSGCAAGTLKLTTVDEALAGPYMVVGSATFSRQK